MTNRHGDWPTLRVFAFDHRMQLEAMDGYTPPKDSAFKRLCLEAALRVPAGPATACCAAGASAALHAASDADRPVLRRVRVPRLVEAGAHDDALGVGSGQRSHRGARSATRGIVVPRLDAPEAELAASFEVAAPHGLVRGFAVGRTIFGEVARAWTKGETADEAAVSEMVKRYARLCGVWDDARAGAAFERSPSSA